MPNGTSSGVVLLVAENAGARIRVCREQRGWSISKLARNAGVSQGYLSDVENGKIAAPSGVAVAKLAAALEVSADYLLGLTDNPAPASTEKGGAIRRDYPLPPRGYEHLSPEERQRIDKLTREFEEHTIELLLREKREREQRG